MVYTYFLKLYVLLLFPNQMPVEGPFQALYSPLKGPASPYIALKGPDHCGPTPSECPFGSAQKWES